jgi:hypothetical protein
MAEHEGELQNTADNTENWLGNPSLLLKHEDARNPGIFVEQQEWH